KGSPVNLVVSNGPPPRQVPLLAGKKFDDAKQELEGLQLVAQRNDVFSDTVQKGQVVSTSPPAGADAPKGPKVTGNGPKGHALLCAQEGAKVVVNDLGGAIDGSGDDRTPAQQVVDEIKAMGGDAVANADNVADWEGGQRLINAAIEAFGDLHVLVNNAGILRDRVLVNMTEEEWDSVIHVHLKGHFVPTRW